MSGSTVHGDQSNQGQWNVSSVSSTQGAEIELTPIGHGAFGGPNDTLGAAAEKPAEVPSAAHLPVLYPPGHAKEKQGQEGVDSDQTDEFVPQLNSALYDAEFLEELSQNLESSTGINPKQRQLARFSLFYPDVDVSKDPKVNETVKETVATAQKSAAANVSQKAGKSWQPPKPDPQLLEMGYKGAVGEALERTGLPKAQQNKLELAHYHPELASPEVLEQYHKLGIADSVTAILAENNMAVPEGYKSKAFDRMLTDNYDSAYETLLQQKGGTLTPHQMDALRSAHYLKTPLTDEGLLKIQSGLEVAARSGVQKEFGISDASTFPPPNGTGYKLIMDANYRVANEEHLFQAVREMGADKAPLLRAALTDPHAEGVTPDIRAKAAEITAKSQAQVSDKFSVKSYEPEGANLMSTPPAQKQLQMKMLAYTKDLYGAAVKSAQDITDVKARMTAMEFLKVTLAAIDQLRQEIARQEVQQADSNKDVSRAQNDTMQYKIQQQAEEATKINEQNDEIAKKQSKMAPFQKLFKALSIAGPALAIIMTVMSAGTLTGPALAFMVIMTTLSAVSLTANIAMAAGASGEGWDVTSDLVGVGAQKLAEKMDFKGAKLLADILMIVVILAAARGGGGEMDSVLKEFTPQLAMMMANTNLCGDIASTAKPDDPQTAAIVGAVGGAVLTFGAVGGFANLMKEGGMTNKGLLNILRTANRLTQASTGAVKLTNSVYQKQILDIQGEVARLQGEYGAKETKAEDALGQLKTLLKQLEKTLEMLVGIYSDTNQLASDVIKGTGEATRGLYQKGLQA